MNTLVVKRQNLIERVKIQLRGQATPIVDRVLDYFDNAVYAHIGVDDIPVFESFPSDSDVPLILIEDFDPNFILHVCVSGSLDGEFTDYVVYTISDLRREGDANDFKVRLFPAKSLVTEYDMTIGVKFFEETSEEDYELFVGASSLSAKVVMVNRGILFSKRTLH